MKSRRLVLLRPAVVAAVLATGCSGESSHPGDSTGGSSLTISSIVPSEAPESEAIASAAAPLASIAGGASSGQSIATIEQLADQLLHACTATPATLDTVVTGTYGVVRASKPSTSVTDVMQDLIAVARANPSDTCQDISVKYLTPYLPNRGKTAAP